MKRVVFVLSVVWGLISVLTPVSAQSPVEKAVGAMHWLDTGYPFGSACILTTIAGKTVYFDPVMDQLPELPAGRSWPKADMIFWTHPHPDHWSFNAVEALGKEGTKYYAPLEITYLIDEAEVPGAVTAEPGMDFTEPGISIHTIPMYTNLDVDKHEKWQSWVSYILKADGVTLLVTGDSGLTPDIRAVKGIDILVIDVLANYMMTVTEAADLVTTMKPQYCIPIHWNGSYEAEAPKLKTMMPPGTTLKFLPLEEGVLASAFKN